MANWEMQLCSRVIRHGCLTEVLEWGVAPEDFLTSEGRSMFNHIVGYYSMANTAGAVIGENAAKQHYPNFQDLRGYQTLQQESGKYYAADRWCTHLRWYHRNQRS